MARPRNTMEAGGHYYIIGIGNSQDWEEGRGSPYYIEDRKGERCLPVFSTADGAQNYAERNFQEPQAHLDMLESLGLTADPSALTAGRFVLMPVTTEILAAAAAQVDAAYLVRDPRPGQVQEVLRLREES